LLAFSMETDIKMAAEAIAVKESDRQMIMAMEDYGSYKVALRSPALPMI